jgi:hypothetical protein
MDPYEIQLRPEAAESFRRLELFERQEVWDLLEDFRAGRLAEEDYGEVTETGQFQSVIIVSQTAVSYVLDRDVNLVRIISILPADK